MISCHALFHLLTARAGEEARVKHITNLVQFEVRRQLVVAPAEQTLTVRSPLGRPLTSPIGGNRPEPPGPTGGMLIADAAAKIINSKCSSFPVL
jgi:hypothetical protein